MAGAGAAEHGALAAGLPGLHPGRRLAARARVRRQARGLDHRHHQRHRGDETLPRRHARPRRARGPRPRQHQGAVPGRPVVADIIGQARDQYERVLATPGLTERTLTLFGSFVDIDFSGFDLDQPLPPLTTNGEQGALDKFCQTSGGLPAGFQAYAPRLPPTRQCWWRLDVIAEAAGSRVKDWTWPCPDASSLPSRTFSASPCRMISSRRLRSSRAAQRHQAA